MVTAEARRYSTYDISSWILLSEMMQIESDPDERDGDIAEWVHTPRASTPVPQVIRLLTYAGRPQSEIRLTHTNIYARDRWRCHYCDRRFSTLQLTLDHVLPRSLGGQDRCDNLVSACHQLQLAQRRTHPAGGEHAAAPPPGTAIVQPAYRHPNACSQVPLRASLRQGRCWLAENVAHPASTRSRWTRKTLPNRFMRVN